MQNEILMLMGLFVLGLAYFRFKTNNGVFGLLAGVLSILMSIEFIQQGSIGFVIIGILLGIYLLYNGLFE